jgi:hypothetical protein
MVTFAENELFSLVEEEQDNYEPIRRRQDGVMPTSSQGSKYNGRHRSSARRGTPKRKSGGMHRRFVKKIR